MQESLKSKPFGDRHIVVIENSDTMTLRAQNRLLKTLEEPPGQNGDNTAVRKYGEPDTDDTVQMR